MDNPSHIFGPAYDAYQMRQVAAELADKEKADGLPFDAILEIQNTLAILQGIVSRKAA